MWWKYEKREKISFLRNRFFPKRNFLFVKKTTTHSKKKILSAGWWIMRIDEFSLPFLSFPFMKIRYGCFCVEGRKNLKLTHTKNVKIFNDFNVCVRINGKSLESTFLSILLALNKSLRRRRRLTAVLFYSTSWNYRKIHTFTVEIKVFLSSIRFPCRFACLNTKLIANWCFYSKEHFVRLYIIPSTHR